MTIIKQRTKPGAIAILLAQLVLILLAFYEMLFSDAFFAPYLFILIFALAGLFLNNTSLIILDRKTRCVIYIFAFLFSMMMMMANYELWENGGFIKLLLWIGMILGGFFAWYNLLYWIAGNMNKIIWKVSENIWNRKAVFLMIFTLIVSTNLIILFQCKYPGNLSPDSTDQINQLLTNQYRNHHPVWHTLTVKLFVSVGLEVFHEINAAVACYSAFSILIMAATFSFAVCTMVELGAPRYFIVLSALYFLLMPYHLMYSMTVWKDVFYGACSLLYIVCLIRYIENIGHNVVNMIVFLTAGIGICLYRNNGFVVMLLTGIILLAFHKSLRKKILLAMAGILIMGFAIKYPLAKMMNVGQPDLVESLSIPVQQVARDVIENDDFTDDQIELLGQIVDLERIPETYSSYISDPIKNLIREKNNQAYLKEHMAEYARVYVTRLLHHPFSYIKAWIDQTKGYWNAGYGYWIWTDSVSSNYNGIQRTVKNTNMESVLNQYLSTFLNNRILRLFISMGFFDWILLVALFIGIIRHDKMGIILTIPCIVNVFTLLVATPVYCELRYNYAVFCSIPFILAFVLLGDNYRPKKQETNLKERCIVKTNSWNEE